MTISTLKKSLVLFLLSIVIWSIACLLLGGMPDPVKTKGYYTFSDHGVETRVSFWVYAYCIAHFVINVIWFFVLFGAALFYPFKVQQIDEQVPVLEGKSGIIMILLMLAAAMIALIRAW